MSGIDIGDIVGRLATGAGVTEADIQADVRSLLLFGGLSLAEDDVVVLEAPVGRGRIDVEAGTTVIEVKRKLRQGAAHREAVKQLARYLSNRRRETGQRYAGILTDGVRWELYHLGADGVADHVSAADLELQGDPSDTDRLLVWLEGVLATAQGIRPTAEEIWRRLGAQSSSFALDLTDLSDIYASQAGEPDVALKRELWARLLTSALGTHFQDTDELFVLHTYLVVSAELIAHQAVGLNPIGKPAAALLSGELFRDASLGGVVEPDFFDWPAASERGQLFVHALARRLARFDWSEVEHDVLKALYESVIDAETRKQLGEYYTPDWLAEGIVENAITAPLEQRVLDPACGSGTFLFWALRRFMTAADEAGHDNAKAISQATQRIAGIDLHPVAVALARVTYILAIGTARLRGERPAFSVPVYLGDSVQWQETGDLFSAGGITLYTTDDVDEPAREFRFPEAVVADVEGFDRLVADLADLAAKRTAGAEPPEIDGVLDRFSIAEADRAATRDSFAALCDLHDARRDHIWGYYIRNRARPFWFAQRENRVDVLLGNPPWLAFRFMPEQMQQLYRSLTTERHLWAGGKVSTQQDLSDLFVARAVEQYLRIGGRFGFVMPVAALSRRQFEGFRAARWDAPGSTTAVSFDQPWDMRRVEPDPFPVPCGVVFGHRSEQPVALSGSVRAWEGGVRHHGARWADATAKLSTNERDVSQIASVEEGSPYEPRFFNGATVYPRILTCIEEVASGPLGVPAGTRRVRGMVSSLANEPWKSLTPLEHVVPAQFVRRMHVGTNLTPFRVLGSWEALIPWVDGELLQSTDPRIDRYQGLAKWWRDAEELWEKHRGEKASQSLTDQLNWHSKLTAQFPLAEERVAYTKSGNRVVACRISDPEAIIDHTLYWTAPGSTEEALYLVTILNSQVLHDAVEPLMAEGLFGKRHADKYVFTVPFPLFDGSDRLHGAIAALGKEAEEIAARVEIPDDWGYVKARRAVREALAESGNTRRTERTVGQLVDRAVAEAKER